MVHNENLPPGFFGLLTPLIIGGSMAWNNTATTGGFEVMVLRFRLVILDRSLVDIVIIFQWWSECRS